MSRRGGGCWGGRREQKRWDPHADWTRELNVSKKRLSIEKLLRQFTVPLTRRKTLTNTEQKQKMKKHQGPDKGTKEGKLVYNG